MTDGNDEKGSKVFMLSFERSQELEFFVKAKSYEEAVEAARNVADRGLYGWEIDEGNWYYSVGKTPVEFPPDYVVVGDDIKDIADDPATDPHNRPCSDCGEPCVHRHSGGSSAAHRCKGGHMWREKKLVWEATEVLVND